MPRPKRPENTRTPSQNGKRAREKGKRFEREVAETLRTFGFSARRGRQYKGTDDSPDVVVEGHPEMAIEAKHREKLNLFATMETLQGEHPYATHHVIFFKRDGDRTLACVDAEVMGGLLQRWFR